MTTHPAHPPSEMVAALRSLFHDEKVFKVGWSGDVSERQADLAAAAIRTMFAHMPQGIMLAAMADADKDFPSLLDAALAAALDAALPGDEEIS